MYNQKIIDTVHQIMVERYEVDAKLLKPEAKLKDDLNLDSLDFVDMLVTLEKKSGKKLPQINLVNMSTLEDVYKLSAILLDEH